MSLDVHLEDENGHALYWRNITHNLNKMASSAGIYECLWRPEEINITTAHQLIDPISQGITFLAMHRISYALPESSYIVGGSGFS